MSTEIKALTDKIASEWEAFKSANDAGRSTEAARINAAIEEATTKIKSIEMALSSSKGVDAVSEAKDRAAFEKKQFGKWLRKGEAGSKFANSAEAKAIEEKAGYNISTPADGGYGVPTVIQQEVERIIQETSPIMQVTSPVTIGGSTQYIKLLDNNDASAGWVSELGTRTTTNANTFTQVAIPTNELYANPQISLEMLEDVQFDAEAELTGTLADLLGRTKNTACVTGSGSGQPTGFLTSSQNALASNAAAVGLLNTILTNTQAAIVSDDIYRLVYNLRDGYRQNGAFAMHRSIMLIVRTLKDSYGRYMWEPNYQAGQPASLAGYPVVEFDDMPQVTTAGTAVITFADWKRFYRPVTRVGLQMLRDPYTVEGSVVYKTRQRFGGKIENGIAGVTLVTHS